MVGSFGKERQLEWPGEETEEGRVRGQRAARGGGGYGGWKEVEQSDLNGAWGSTLRWG